MRPRRFGGSAVVRDQLKSRIVRAPLDIAISQENQNIAGRSVGEPPIDLLLHPRRSCRFKEKPSVTNTRSPPMTFRSSPTAMGSLPIPVLSRNISTDLGRYQGRAKLDTKADCTAGVRGSRPLHGYKRGSRCIAR